MIDETISHYRILEKLGEGGMGVVYKAEDTKLQRTVAIKFLPPELTRDPEAKGRFIHEARAASALEHHNICTIHEIDETNEGQTFMVMACYEGESLDEKIERGPLKIDEAADIASQIAQGLSKAHEKEIVHRDIKPANILITDDGMVKILDFGLAKLRGKTKLTKEGTTLGTVSYMSPEQTRGEDVDHRSDIWSLGVVLYEMITGRRPFKGDYDQAVMYSILNEQPEPVTGLRTGVPIELERIVEKCQHKDPGERYQTVSGLLADFRHFQRVSTTQAIPQETQVSKPPRVSRKRYIVGIAVLVIVVTVAVVLLERQFTPSDHPTIQERKMLVVLPFENLGPPEDEYFADGITEEITSRLAALHGLGVISRTSAFHYRETDKTIRQIGQELNVDYVLEGTVRWQKTADGPSTVRVTPQLIRVSDDTHLWTERYDERLEEIFTVQSKIAEGVVRALDITLLEPERKTLDAVPTDNLDAYNAYLRGLEHLENSFYLKEKIELAVQMFERAVELDPYFALAYTGLSRAHNELYHFGYDRTDKRLLKAKEAVDRALEIQQDLPQAHRALGLYYYWGQLDYDRALEEFTIVLKSHPNDPDILSETAFIWRRQGKFNQALVNQIKAVELNPRDYRTIFELALTYHNLRNYSEAISYYDRSISIAPDQSHAYLFKALCYWAWNGNLEKARTVLEEIPDRLSNISVWMWYYQALFERNYQEALNQMSSLPFDVLENPIGFAPKSLFEGFIFSLMGDSLRAHASFNTARTFLEQAVVEMPNDPRVHRSLGYAYAGLGLKDDAIREGKQAVELCPVSKDALRGPDSIRDLALIYLVLGEYDMGFDQIDYLLSIPNWYSIQFFSLHPYSPHYKDHPRYKKLVEKYSGDSL